MIEISGLTKIYDDVRVVDGLSLKIKPGSVFGFLGPNGAGKTTSIKMIVGLIPSDEGTAIVGESSLSFVKARESVGYMPENPYFYDYLTGMEFLRFCGQLFARSYTKTTEQYEEILKEVDIYEARNLAVRAYSKGMKQRLGFAQAIVNDPEYVFLDEPLDGLDPIGRREIKQIILRLKQQGKTVFFNSHILSDVHEMCDEIGIINRGKLLYLGPVVDFCRGRPLEERFVEEVEKNLKSFAGDRRS